MIACPASAAAVDIGAPWKREVTTDPAPVTIEDRIVSRQAGSPGSLACATSTGKAACARALASGPERTPDAIVAAQLVGDEARLVLHRTAALDEIAQVDVG